MVFTRTKIKTMCQNLNRTIKTGLFLIAWLPTLLFGQDLVMRDFSYRLGQVTYIGKVRCMGSRVIIRSSLQVTTPKGAVLDRYVEPVTLTVMESFSIPDGLDEVFLWDAMLAKQYLTIAQGYFQTGTRYCAVNTAAHGGNDASASEVDRLLTLIEAIRTNADYGLAKLQFDEYYSINYKIMKSCICLEDGFDDQYKCVTLK